MAHSKSPKPVARHAGGKGQQNGRPPRRARIGAVPASVPGFASRADLVRTVSDALAAGTSVVLAPGSTFAEGPRNWLGASGKTQLAAAVAETLWRSAAVDLLIWIEAADRAALLCGLAHAAFVTTGEEPPGTADPAARFVSWLRTTKRRWLVVLDDVPDVAALDELWPAGPAGRVLITTPRFPVRSGRSARVVPVGVFTVREALSCVTERLNAAPGQREGAIDLIESVGREPLALAQACSVLESSGMTCLEYRDYLVRRRQQLRVVPGEVPAAAAATWTLSLDHAEVLQPGELIRLTLVLVALLDGHGIPGQVFDTTAVERYLGRADNVLNALQVLDRAGLVSLDDVSPGGLSRPATPTVRMSLAVQAAVLAAAPSRLRARAAVVAADALLEVWPAAEPHPWTAARLRSNVESLWHAAAEALLADGCHPVLIRAGCSLDDTRLSGPAVEFWQRLAEVAGVPGHPDAAAVSARLAAACLAAAQGAEAAVWYRRVLAERTRVLVQGSPAITEARVGLGRALLLAGQGDEAVPVLTEAALEAEKFAVPGSAGALAAQDALAAAYLAAGRAADAITLLERALADRERAAGARDLATIVSRERLAAALLADGQGREAAAHTKQVLADREAVLGKAHPDTIAARATHAAAVHATGRMPAALQLIERACADSAAVLGADHVATLTRQVSLAHVYYAVGRVGDAASVLRDTLARAGRVLAPDDPLTATVQQSLANLTGDSGGDSG